MTPLGFISGGTTMPTNARSAMYTAGATNIGLVIQGAASQTADLFQLQNSAGAFLAGINNVGEYIGANAVRATQILTSNYWARMQEQSSGGKLMMRKLTAVATSPGADYGVLAFRDGTNAGTLKLVVRAGAAGAETTILDNIPQ
jgi:hypothetical protein